MMIECLKYEMASHLCCKKLYVSHLDGGDNSFRISFYILTNKKLHISSLSVTVICERNIYAGKHLLAINEKNRKGGAYMHIKNCVTTLAEGHEKWRTRGCKW